jgi:hypothetical protein
MSAARIAASLRWTGGVSAMRLPVRDSIASRADFGTGAS